MGFKFELFKKPAHNNIVEFDASLDEDRLLIPIDFVRHHNLFNIESVDFSYDVKHEAIGIKVYYDRSGSLRAYGTPKSGKRINLKDFDKVQLFGNYKYRGETDGMLIFQKI